MFSSIVRVGARLSGRFAGQLRKAVHGGQRSLSTTSAKLSESKPANGSAEETIKFEASTKRLLDIVAKSLYSENEVFLRELLANGQDAISKLHFYETAGFDMAESFDNGVSPHIRIETEEGLNKLIIEDYGVGMTKQEMIDNLGTIARSGSREFAEKTEHIQREKEYFEKGPAPPKIKLDSVDKDGAAKTAKAANPDYEYQSNLDNLIGQFGVGFYSALMVADRVEVISRSCLKGHGCYRWVYGGEADTFTVSQLPDDHPDANHMHGTRIVLHLKKECSEFSKPDKIKALVRKFGNFSQHRIIIDDHTMQGLRPLWLYAEESIEADEHDKMLEFLSGRPDKPLYKFRFSTDSPYEIRSLFYVPENNTENVFAGQRLFGGVHIFQKSIMVQESAKGVLPDWMRFVKGAVSSPDIPLNLSRELLQDNRTLTRIGDVITSKIIDQLRKSAELKDDNYAKFLDKYGVFIKEGVISDDKNRERLAPLLRFHTSRLAAPQDPHAMVSLDEYIDGMEGNNEVVPEGEKKKIFYLVTDSYQKGTMSPYYEPFMRAKREVLFFIDPMDEFACNSLRAYKDHEFVSIETSSATKSIASDSITRAVDYKRVKAPLLNELIDFIKSTLGPARVNEVRASDKMVLAPLVVVDHMSLSQRRMLKMMRAQVTGSNSESSDPLEPQTLEVSTESPTVHKLASLVQSDRDMAAIAVENLFDAALVTANLQDDPQVLVRAVESLTDSLIPDISDEHLDDSAPTHQSTPNDDEEVIGEVVKDTK